MGVNAVVQKIPEIIGGMLGLEDRWQIDMQILGIEFPFSCKSLSNRDSPMSGKNFGKITGTVLGRHWMTWNFTQH